MQLAELFCASSLHYIAGHQKESNFCQAVIERLNAEINTITATPEVVSRLSDMGIYPQRDSVAGAREFFASQQRAMKKLVTELGVVPQ